MNTATKRSLSDYMGKGRPRTVVPLPDSGGMSVILSVIDGAALMDAEALHSNVSTNDDADSRKKFCAFVLAHSIVDEDGKRLYADNEAHLLLKLPLPAWLLLWPKCAKLNGMTEEALAKASKKSDKAKPSASSTAGRTTSEKPSVSSPRK